ISRCILDSPMRGQRCCAGFGPLVRLRVTERASRERSLILAVGPLGRLKTRGLALHGCVSAVCAALDLPVLGWGRSGVGRLFFLVLGRMASLVSGWVWFGVFVEIKSRGVVRVCLLVCGGLVGLSGLIDTAWGVRRGGIALSISFVCVRVSSRGASTGGFLLLDRSIGVLGLLCG